MHSNKFWEIFDSTSYKEIKDIVLMYSSLVFAINYNCTHPYNGITYELSRAGIHIHQIKAQSITVLVKTNYYGVKIIIF